MRPGSPGAAAANASRRKRLQTQGTGKLKDLKESKSQILDDPESPKNNQLKKASSTLTDFDPDDQSPSAENAGMGGLQFGLGRGVPKGYRERICMVKGTVIKARGLMDLDAWGKSDPYCIVKGIKGNGRMVLISRSPVIQDELNPVWNFDFSFECPQEWGYTELVGIKLLVFDSDQGYDANDDFLGGCDVDIADDKDFPHRATVHKDVELQGQQQGKKQIKGLGKKKKARIEFDVSVFRCVEPAPLSRYAKVLKGLEKLFRVYEIEGIIVSASGLRDADVAGLSDPHCIVRLQFMDGKEHEIARTAVIPDTLTPVWNESFRLGFTRVESPVALKFDVYDVDEGEIGGGDDDHLGGVTVLLAEILEQKLKSAARFTLDLQAAAGEKELAETGRASFLRGKKKKGLGSITLELFARAITEPLPHVELLHPPVEENAHGKEKIIRAPFRKEGEDDNKAKSLKNPLGKERVFFISGRVLFATNLVDADLWGKSDPYCVVECPIEGTNTPLDVHRTRTCDDDLNPVWNEAFTCVVPEHLDIKKIVLSVYDDDDGEMADDGDPDFLGRATIDLGDIGHGQVLREEAPLVGIKKKRKTGQGLRAGGFKRDSTIGYEIRVERRIVLLPEAQVDNSVDAQAKRLGLSAKPRHQESRRPDLSMYSNRKENKGMEVIYTDSSQAFVEDRDRATAQRVMQYREFTKFAAATASSGWSSWSRATASSSTSQKRVKQWLEPREESTRRWANSTSESFFKPRAEDKDMKVEEPIYDSTGNEILPTVEKKEPKRQGFDYDFTGFRPDWLRRQSSLPRVPISSVFGRPNSEQGWPGEQGPRQSQTLSRSSTPNFAGGIDPQTSIRELRFRPPIMMYCHR